jgi:hypothetical protein
MLPSYLSQAGRQGILQADRSPESFQIVPEQPGTIFSTRTTHGSSNPRSSILDSLVHDFPCCGNILEGTRPSLPRKFLGGFAVDPLPRTFFAAHFAPDSSAPEISSCREKRALFEPLAIRLAA